MNNSENVIKLLSIYSCVSMSHWDQRGFILSWFKVTHTKYLAFNLLKYYKTIIVIETIRVLGEDQLTEFLQNRLNDLWILIVQLQGSSSVVFFFLLWHTFSSLFNHLVNETMEKFQCMTNPDLLPIVSTSMQFHWHSIKYLIDVLQCHSLFPLAALILLSLVITWEILFVCSFSECHTRWKKGNLPLLYTIASLVPTVTVI